MSGPIRRLLGPTKARLQTYIPKAQKILQVPINELTDLDAEEMEIEELINRICTNLSLLERCNDDWIKLLKELDGEQKEKEDKEYSWAAEGTDGIIELLIDSKETASRLEARLTLVLRKRERAMKEKTAAASPLRSPLSQETINNSCSKVKLPKLHLTSFDGNILNWQEFWDIFNSAVHTQEISNVTKFSYLKNSVRGAAYTAIHGISVTDDNYDVAVQILKDKFGKKEVIIEALYSQLQHLPLATSRFNDIKHNYEAMEKIFRQLESQAENIDQQRMLVQQILSKFPTEVIVKLEEMKDLTKAWSVKLLRESLKCYVNVHENARRYEFNSKGQSYRNNKRSDFKSQRSFTEKQGSQSVDTFVVDSRKSSGRQQNIREPKYPCVFCKGAHFNDNCQKYTSLSSRKQQLSNQGRCFICLKVGHMYKDCSNPYLKKCYYCGKCGHHNRSICPKQWADGTEATVVSQSSVSQSSVNSSENNPSSASNEVMVETDIVTPAVSSDHMLLVSGERVILQTAVAPVYCVNGSTMISARILLDSASQRTFMTESFAKKLNLPVLHRETLSISTFGSQGPQNIDTYVVNLTLLTKEGSQLSLHANVLNQITAPIRRGPLQEADLIFLQAITPSNLADSIPRSSELAPIDILVGSDYFWNIVGGERIVLPSGLLLLSSKLGYLLTGRFMDPNCDAHLSSQLSACFVMTQMNQSVSELNLFSSADIAVNKCPNLSDLWRLDTIGICEPAHIDDNDRALEQFNKTIKFDGERYQIAWPWKDCQSELPDNYDVALERMKSLSRRLQSNRNLLQQYNDILQSQLEQGIVERVLEADVDNDFTKHYLPHHPVVKPSRNTTKVRIVYDASAKSRKNVKCLNDCLYRGPITLPDLCGVLLRLRTYLIVILADVEKAFLQIGIQRQERDVTRFLWFRNSNQPEKVEGNLDIYRFCRVPFGIVSSPFLLEGTLKFHLQCEGTPVSKKISDNLYVDNVSIGAESVEESYQIYKEARNIFKKASMNLREWTSNSKEFLCHLPEDHRATGTTVKLFGLLWNRIDDYIQIVGIDFIKQGFIVTKREVLRCVARIYDPLGFITPITFHGKVFLQNLWKYELTWDEQLSETLCQEFYGILEILQHLPAIKIPRFIGTSECQPVYDLLVFCDASIRSYATVIYLRVTTHLSTYSNLVFSKMRLAPVVSSRKKPKKSGQITLPRLELLAVLIGVRAGKFVAKELKLPISNKFLWTDSECVLHWMRTTKPLPLFIKNRIKEIRCHDDITFFYVPLDGL